MQFSQQAQWQYTQRVCNASAHRFQPLRKTIREKLLPALFGTTLDEHDPVLRLALLPVKFAGLGLLDPVDHGHLHWQTSRYGTSYLAQCLLGKETTPFSVAVHLETLGEERARTAATRAEEFGKVFHDQLDQMPPLLQRTIRRGCDTGQWLQLHPSTFHRTLLSREEWTDNVQLRYGKTPANLPRNCDGCGKQFSVTHGLECKIGGLINFRHNEVRDELSDMAAQALSPGSVRSEPLILSSCTSPSDNAPSANADVVTNYNKTRDGERGDILIRSFYERGLDVVLDVRVTDTDATSYEKKDPTAVLDQQAKDKKRRYLRACLEQQRSFVPFVVSVDGLLQWEAHTFLQHLSHRLAKKLNQPYSQVCGAVRARISLACARATHLCLRGSRVPIDRVGRRLDWADGTALSTLRY